MAKQHVRYGAELRKRAAGITKLKKARYICPQCSKLNVKREGNALWECRSCGAEFAGGAYQLATSIGETGNRMVSDLRAAKAAKK